ncbi:hydroxyproline dehydrogenase-like [Saccostrea cucullata]|uniref:hydroxyproline dehydrogenase-like n=1 Tax=Saccostrea cuccullata TaxID=36930 RepID=UPI002ED5002E
MKRGTSLLKILRKTNLKWNFPFYRSQHTNTVVGPEKDRGLLPDQEVLPRTLDFDDAVKACQSQTTWELLRALLIFKVCSFEKFVENNYKILSWSRRLMGRPLFNAMMRPTIYKQFVGGDDVTSFQATVDRLQAAGMGPLVMVTLEEDVKDDGPDADQLFDRNLKIMVDCIEMTSKLGSQNPMMQIKPSGLFPLHLCRMISTEVPYPNKKPEVVEKVANAMQTSKEITELGNLSSIEIAQLNKALQRLKHICKVAMEKNVIIMVDAEYTYLNPCLNLLALAMMLNSNNSAPLVFYTYQNYLKETPDILSKDKAFVKAHGVSFGSKLVRGAYLYKERSLAKEKGYPDPVCETFEKTTENYNRSMDIMLNNIAKYPGKFSTIIASHNEDTIKRGISKLNELGIPRRGTEQKVFFGQLYGMSDFISQSLGQAGYMIHKSIPYGTIDEALPYLSRRVGENSSIFGGIRRERKIIRRALADRNFIFNSIKILSWSRRLMGRPLFNMIMRPTFYRQFVGGHDLASLQTTVDRLQAAGIGPFKAISLEIPRPNAQQNIVEKIANSMHTSNEITELGNLKSVELQQLNKALYRMKQICEVAKEKNVIVMVDAEYTYLNPCLNLLTLAMMMNSNGSAPLVFYTYQNYLKETPSILAKDIALMQAHGISFGAKLVRGAYLHKERSLAKEKGYPDPVCETFEKTSANYYRSMDIMLDNIAKHPGKFSTIIASHNEATIKRAIYRMTDLGISRRSKEQKVFFGQTYGMSDFISLSLGQTGYMIHKSIPYGTVDEVLPYLSRRVNENSSIFGGMRRERSIIRRALADRVLSKT